MIFWLLLPLALVSMAGGQLYIHNQVVSRQEKFDAPALILLSLTLFTIIYALSLIGGSNLAWILLLAGVILFALFVFVNKSGDNHLLNLSIFKEKTVCLVLWLEPLSLPWPKKVSKGRDTTLSCSAS